ncbi:MAG: hypothetical protein KJ626_00155 [Verrucomicrobia bacterium]|nr:hypothetical protein [Verrucomicrobiota bacterium]
MKSFEQVKDILDEAKFFHDQLKGFYTALHDKVEKDKLKLILDYLCRHEDLMREMLDEFEEGAASAVLDTWYKYTPNVSIGSCIAEIKPKPDMTLDELMTIAVQLENCFLSLYKHAADRAPSAQVKEVFDRLYDESRTDRQKLVRDLTEMEDLV